jgi:hypothetical protein
MGKSLYFCKQLDYDDDKRKIITDFIIFCAKELDIFDKEFSIYIESKRDGKPIVTTAAYSPDHKTCYIYGKNRATVDVCRSIAHEMTHMMQDYTGNLLGLIKDVGGFHEDQANAKAGEIIKKFAYSGDDRMKLYESFSRFID